MRRWGLRSGVEEWGGVLISGRSRRECTVSRETGRAKLLWGFGLWRNRLHLAPVAEELMRVRMCRMAGSGGQMVRCNAELGHWNTERYIPLPNRRFHANAACPCKTQTV